MLWAVFVAFIAHRPVPTLHRFGKVTPNVPAEKRRFLNFFFAHTVQKFWFFFNLRFVVEQALATHEVRHSLVEAVEIFSKYSSNSMDSVQDFANLIFKNQFKIIAINKPILVCWDFRILSIWIYLENCLGDSAWHPVFLTQIIIMMSVICLLQCLIVSYQY